MRSTRLGQQAIIASPSTQQAIIAHLLTALRLLSSDSLLSKTAAQAFDEVLTVKAMLPPDVEPDIKGIVPAVLRDIRDGLMARSICSWGLPVTREALIAEVEDAFGRNISGEFELMLVHCYNVMYGGDVI